MWPSNSKTRALVLGLLLCTSASAFAESRRRGGDDCLTDAACSSLYEEARRLSKSGDLQAALVAYQAAYRRQAVPWLLINIGRTLQKLGRLQEALAHYQRYSAAEPSGLPERQQMIREYTAQAEKALADKAAAERAKPVDVSEPPEPAPAPLLPVVEPARPPIVAKDPTLATDETAAPRPKPVAEARRLPAYFWAGLGIGGALIVGGAITGGLALGQAQSLQTTAYAGPPSDALLADQSRVRALALTTDVLLPVGGATVLAVTIAALVQRSRQRGPRTAAVTVQAELGGLSGRF